MGRIAIDRSERQPWVESGRPSDIDRAGPPNLPPFRAGDHHVDVVAAALGPRASGDGHIYFVPLGHPGAIWRDTTGNRPVLAVA
jgi:hypothetical protein